MRTLLIDNYDSFTFNLYQLIAKVNGTPPIVVRNDGVTWAEIEALCVDNIVISPGPGRPDRPADFGVSADAIRHSKVPVLGVCLGHQGLANSLGGRVVLAPQEMHGRISRIRHDGSALFTSIPESFEVVRYHSLLVDAASLPETLLATAWTVDGLIMGLAHKTRPLYGVQFHPESISTEYGEQLLSNFRALTPTPTASSSRGPTKTLVPEGRKSPGTTAYDLRFLKLPWHDPETAFDALYAQSPSAFWLDSSSAERSRYSFMGDASGPLALTLHYRHREASCVLRSVDGEETRPGSVFDVMRDVLRERAASSQGLPFGFQGGFVGYLGYGLKADCGGSDAHPAAEPDALLHFCDRFLAFDHHERATYVVTLTKGEPVHSSAWMSDTASKLSLLQEKDPTQTLPRIQPHPARASRAKPRYLQDIQGCLDAIRQGESYELCLTNMLHVDAHVDSLALHRELRRRSPAPYAALLRFEGLDVVSSSPERFLRIARDGRVESKPIKGTRPRGATVAEDALLARDLATSEKDRAENLMIVDLVRNDLGQVCEVGSVHVPKLMDVETYASVHQLVSTVVGQLRTDADAIDCVQCAFPGGSMTGAPKRRTMRLLDTFETEARSVYSGAIGYLSIDGSIDLSIAIRCALVREDDVRIGTGGAIVALSDPEEEFEETQLKARVILEALAAALSLAQE
ncbi:MAG: aminodeoxychorismate synthase component I [Polyangiales bacterium]